MILDSCHRYVCCHFFCFLLRVCLLACGLLLVLAVVPVIVVHFAAVDTTRRLPLYCHWRPQVTPTAAFVLAVTPLYLWV